MVAQRVTDPDHAGRLRTHEKQYMPPAAACSRPSNLTQMFPRAQAASRQTLICLNLVLISFEDNKMQSARANIMQSTRVMQKRRARNDLQTGPPVGLASCGVSNSLRLVQGPLRQGSSPTYFADVDNQFCFFFFLFSFCFSLSLHPSLSISIFPSYSPAPSPYAASPVFAR